MPGSTPGASSRPWAAERGACDGDDGYRWPEGDTTDCRQRGGDHDGDDDGDDDGDVDDDDDDDDGDGNGDDDSYGNDDDDDLPLRNIKNKQKSEREE